MSPESDATFINPDISDKFNIGRYGINGHFISNDAGKVLAIFNESSKDDYGNWLDAVRYGKQNPDKIREGHEERLKKINEPTYDQLTLF